MNQAGVRPNGAYVLYWLRHNRRVESNHALAYATGLANRLALPLLAFESLPSGVPYASDRHHAFILEGVPELAAAFRKRRVGYVFHLPRHLEDGVRAIDEAVARAAAVVTDDYPASVERHLGLPTPDRIDIQCFAVDSSCVVPATLIPRCHAAYSFRPKVRKVLDAWLQPAAETEVEIPFPPSHLAPEAEIPGRNLTKRIESCAIDHSVRPSLGFRGGRAQAERRLAAFLEERLYRYASERNEPSAHATSDLSPYLHFGHISALEVALAVEKYARRHRIVAEEFLEELIVRRELAFNFALHAARVDSLEELPDWASATLQAHRRDRRDPVYNPARFEAAGTHDDLWNAAQKELLLRGKIHGYYRMYWGKKILEWSKTPEEALSTMIRLHDRYAIDGRDPNTYGNILWCFGLHDRPWPERPIYGKIRSMTRGGMDRKTATGAYIKEIEDLERTGKELHP